MFGQGFGKGWGEFAGSKHMIVKKLRKEKEARVGRPSSAATRICSWAKGGGDCHGNPIQLCHLPLLFPLPLPLPLPLPWPCFALLGLRVSTIGPWLCVCFASLSFAWLVLAWFGLTWLGFAFALFSLVWWPLPLPLPLLVLSHLPLPLPLLVLVRVFFFALVFVLLVLLRAEFNADCDALSKYDNATRVFQIASCKACWLTFVGKRQLFLSGALCLPLLFSLSLLLRFALLAFAFEPPDSAIYLRSLRACDGIAQ